MQSMWRVLLACLFLCGLYATTTVGSAASTSVAPAKSRMEIQPSLELAATGLTCHGQVCSAGEICCSCRLGPGQPLQFFCSEPSSCHNGSICMIP